MNQTEQATAGTVPDLSDDELAKIQGRLMPLVLRAARALFFGGTIFLLLNCQTYLHFNYVAFSFAMAGVGSINSLSRLTNMVIVLLIVLTLLPKDFVLWAGTAAGRLIGAA